jgi:eukaryotic-like serine/threonine-protein kinase
MLTSIFPRIAPPLTEICVDPDREPATRSNAAEALGALLLMRGDVVELARAAVRARPDAARILFLELSRVDDVGPARQFLRSVLAEPAANPTDEAANESLAARQANAAVALASLHEPSVLWPLLRHRTDPRLRTRTIQTLARSDVAAIVPPRLSRPRAELDPSEHQALLMTLAEAERADLDALINGPVADLVADQYADHPDAAVHSAAWLVLRRWGRNDLIAQADERMRVRPDPIHPAHRGWRAGPNGHTFLTLRGPITFRMGSPSFEADRYPRETLHARRIDRSLEVATKEVTVRQFLNYVKDRPIDAKGYSPDPRYGTDPDLPAHEVNFYESMRYCNWLSRKANLEPCYPEPVESGMTLPENLVDRHGFRVPTEAEWEYFCRAETSTARPFGSTDELLPRYGWTFLNSRNLLHPVASLLPNDFGLFDVMGNVWEWCGEGLPPIHKEGYPPYPTGTEEAPAVDRGQGGPIKTDEAWRLLRGGSFPYAPAESRSANRYMVNVSLADPYIGFRVVRTLP